MTSHTMFEAMLRDPSKEERTKIFFAIKKIRSNNVAPCNVGGGRGSTVVVLTNFTIASCSHMMRKKTRQMKEVTFSLMP